MISPKDMSETELEKAYVDERKLCDELATFVLQNKEAVHPDQQKHAQRVLDKYVAFRSPETNDGLF